MKIKSFLTVLALSLLTLSVLTSCGDDDPVPAVTTDDNHDHDDDTPQAVKLEVLRTCDSCHGSKECVKCGGSGYGCDVCNNTGKYCADCNSTGRHKECNGTGNCKECSGDGWQNCLHCKYGECTICGGTGRSSGGNTCWTCKGTKICTWCNGTRKSGNRCWYCDATGDCPGCDNGKCRKCGGTAKCWKCGGDAHCAQCGGKGECYYCDGKGKRFLPTIQFWGEGGDIQLFINCSSQWQISADVDWISFSSTSGYGNATVTATALTNPKFEVRSGTVTITSGDEKIELWLLQGANIDVIDDNDGDDDDDNDNDDNGDNDGDEVEGTTVSLDLKKMLDKPFGTVNVDLRTASYQQVKNAITGSGYKIYESSENVSLYVMAHENPSLKTFAYFDMPFLSFNFDITFDDRTYSYGFEIDKSKNPNGYESYLNKVVQDFSQHLGITMTKVNSQFSLDGYYGYDANSTYYSVSIYEWDDYYSLTICISYR